MIADPVTTKLAIWCVRVAYGVLLLTAIATVIWFIRGFRKDIEEE